MSGTSSALDLKTFHIPIKTSPSEKHEQGLRGYIPRNQKKKEVTSVMSYIRVWDIIIKAPTIWKAFLEVILEQDFAPVYFCRILPNGLAFLLASPREPHEAGVT